MAAPAQKDKPLVDDDQPDVALGNVIDAISALGDRVVVLRRLETEDAEAKARFDKVARREWGALENCARTITRCCRKTVISPLLTL